MVAIAADFSGDVNIGLYGLATDSYFIVPQIKAWVEEKMVEALGVKVVKASLAGTRLMGIFSAGNSNGLLVPELARKQEIEALKKHIEVIAIKGKYTALGNLVVANDKGCLISERLEKYKGAIGDFLGVKVVASNIAGLDIVGSLCMATNKGCLVSKLASKDDLDVVEGALGVKASFATVNFGSVFVKSGIIANSRGVVMGSHTTGPEMQNITEMLGLI